MKKVYFASDIHLGSGMGADPKTIEKHFVSWLDSIRHDASAVYLLGDIFDFWYEYKYVIPKGFVRFLGKIAEMTDSGIEIHFLTGNHDLWMEDYLVREIGVIIHHQPIVTTIHGKRFYLAHGDGLGDHSPGFLFIRRIFHNKTCQKLFRALHPAIGFRFARACSQHSRKKSLLHPVPYRGDESEPLVRYARKYIDLHPETDFLIFGHRHILLDLPLSPQNRMIILGDWINLFSYCVLEGNYELRIMNYGIR